MSRQKLGNRAQQGCELRRGRVFAARLGAGALAAFMAAALASGGSRSGGVEPARVDPASSIPGGAATSRGSTNTRDAFSHSSGNLGFRDEFTFKLGNAIFRKVWVSSPSSTTSSDGLGPLYNARSCQRCHLKDGRGHPPAANWPKDNAISMFLRLSIPPQNAHDRELLKSGRADVIPDPIYGTQLQNFAIQGHPAEGRMHITYAEKPVRLSDGTVVNLRQPTYSITDFGYGPPHPDLMMSPRIAPQMIGLGLLEAIPEADILANADPDDRNGDGISGRPNRVWSIAKGAVTLGRFGWKAGMPSIRQQSIGAFAGDMGLSSYMMPQPSGDCTERQPHCLKAPNGRSADDEEVPKKFVDLVTFYASNLAVPRRRDGEHPDVVAGERIFRGIGCAACHKPSFRTGENKFSPNLGNQTIWPYTDLLLHDMGEGLADGRPEGRATGREWRTAPLWGIGLTETVSGHTFFLHDGRARGLLEAIIWHGGEAKPARDRVIALSAKDRERLLAFVKSL